MRQEDNYWIRRSRLTRRHFVGGAAVAGVGAAGLALVGCGDDDDDSKTTPSGGATTAPAASPTAGAAQPVKGGVLRAQIPNVFDSVDVHRAFGDPTSWLSNYVINKVVRYKNPDTGEIEGDLAESYESPDGQTFTFKVRQGVKWQNTPLTNGREFTAEDIKWHFERQAAGKLKDGTESPMRFGSFYKTLSKIETPDKSTIKITLAAPNGSFLDRLSGYFSTVPNREATEKFEADHRTLSEEAMPATGDFTLKKWRAGQEIVFVRNPDNFRKGQPQLDGWLAPLLFEDPNAYRAAFEQKQIDGGFSSPDPSLTKSIIEAHKDQMYEYLTGVGNTVFLHLNMNKQFKDVRLVQAMNMAVDRRLLIQTFHQGLGQVSGPVTWLQEGYAIKPDDLVKLPGWRTDREAEKKEARALWAAGGGPALGDVDIKVPDTWLLNWPDTTQVLIKMFNDSLGVTQFKSTKTTYNEEIIPNLFNGNFPNWFGWTSQVNSPDPRPDLFSNFHSKGSTNFQKVNNPDLDKLLTDASVLTDRTKAVAIVLQAQKVLTDNGQYGNVILYNYIARSAGWNYFHANLKTQPSAGKPGAGYNIFAGQLAGANTWIDTKDPSYQGRPAASI